MSKKYPKIKKYVGITSATVLMTIGTCSGISLVAVNAQELPTSEHIQNQEDVKEVVRTIKVDDPYRGMQTITQVVRFAKHKDKWVAQTPNYWPTFILPNYDDFEPDISQVKAASVKPDDECQTITINYHQYRPSEREQLLSRMSTFYLFDENFQMTLSPVNVNQVKVGEWYCLPKPPKGYEYVDADALPKNFKAYHSIGNYYHLLVRPIQKENVSNEEKVVERSIHFELPTGIKSVIQKIKFARDVKTISEKLNIKSFGEWRLVEEGNIEIPVVNGYHASLGKLPTVAGKLPEEIESPVIINYTADQDKNKDEHLDKSSGGDDNLVKDETEKANNKGAQTEVNDNEKEIVDEEEQIGTGKPGDDSSQRIDLELKDQEAQTNEQEDKVNVIDESTQTEEVGQVEVDNENSQTEGKEVGVSEKINEKEIDVLPPIKDEKHLTDKGEAKEKEVGSQTDNIEGKIETKDQRSQTDEEIPDKKTPNISTREDIHKTALTREKAKKPVGLQKAEAGNEDKPMSALTDDEVQRVLDQTQASLTDLAKKDGKAGTSHSLPQTGNEVGTKTTVAGILLTAIVAFTSMFFLHRQNKN
ncbi:hypothetical protein AALA17_02500 [Lactobacillaceae bacterium 24-114]